MKTPLRIAILECDTPPPAIVEKQGKYGAIFTRLLETAAVDVGLNPKQDLVLSSFDVVTAQEYPNLDDIDAVLISGSKHNSFDSHPWILKLVAFTEALLQQSRIRILGVCFGHQILGRALGADVGRSEQGWEISVLPVELTEKGKEIFGVETLSLHQMHRDALPTYPPTVTPLAHSPRCSTQAMYTPNRLLSVQGHPEFNEEIVKYLVEMRHAQGLFGDEEAGDALERVGRAHDGGVVGRAFLRFLLEE
ncbi:hypothetical protein J1614_001085 [Plenodomus biglobosus]|nr:hypothetical protein J1614_001085 [Plenodomus biglobosus]